MPSPEQIELLGNFGEFIGSIAVLITLIYLTVQTRQSKALLEENRRIALSQVFQTRVGYRMENHLRIADPSIAAVMAKVDYSPDDPEAGIKRYQELSRVEQVQYSNLHQSNMQLVENTKYQRDLNLLDDETIFMSRRFASGYLPLWQALNLPTGRIEKFLDEDS